MDESKEKRLRRRLTFGLLRKSCFGVAKRVDESSARSKTRSGVLSEIERPTWRGLTGLKGGGDVVGREGGKAVAPALNGPGDHPAAPCSPPGNERNSPCYT